MAPPDFTLSAVVKYGLPRFFGMMNTLSPVFSAPEAPELAGADAEEPPDPLPEELHAASVAEATRSTAGAQKTLFLERLISESFQLCERAGTGPARVEPGWWAGGRV
jgi:hypothetical protein